MSGMKVGQVSMNQASKQITALKKFNPLKSVGTKLFIYIIGGILACVISMGVLAYSEAKSLVEKKVSDSSQQTVNQLAVNLDNILKTYEDVTLQVLVDSEFHKQTDTIIQSTDDYSRYEGIKQISNKLQGFIFGNSTISGMALIPLHEKLSIVTTGTALSTSVEKQLNEPWLQDIIAADGRTVWIDPSKGMLTQNNNNPNFLVGRVIKNTTSSVANYVLMLEISTKAILDELEKVSLGAGSEVSIVGEHNKYIVNKNASLIGQQAIYNIDFADENSKREVINEYGEMLLVHKKLNKTGWYLVGQIPVNELVKDAESIGKLTIIVSLAAAVIAVLIAVIVIMTISRPLVQLRNLMIKGAEGDLTVRSTMGKRNDEIGQLGIGFNQMMTQITALATQTKASAEAVLQTAGTLSEASNKTALSAKEIAVATEEIANGSTSLAVEAEKGSDLTLLINEQMEQVLLANKEMVQSAHQVETASEQGTAYMAELIEKTGMTEEMTREMVEKVDSLKDSTSSIVKILDVLNTVTKQTNILSLNATIEAARAGTAGRGFMVVANEIRDLADQSTQSIEVVAQITDRIQTEIGETVAVLSKAYPMFQEQIDSVKEANGIFVTVQSQMSGLITRLEDVTHSVSKLEESQVVLNDAMTNVSSVAEQSSATSEEVASLSMEQMSISDHLVSLSGQLNAVSGALKDSLSKFKVE